jgi:hypothetical protein
VGGAAGCCAGTKSARTVTQTAAPTRAAAAKKDKRERTIAISMEYLFSTLYQSFVAAV